MLVGTKFLPYLRKIIQGGQIFKYRVDERKRIRDDQAINIYWDTQGKNMKLCEKIQAPLGVKICVRVVCNIEDDDDQEKQATVSCSRSNIKVEDAANILECEAESVILEQEESTTKMKKWLDSYNSCPYLIRLIISAMENWKQ